MIKVDLVETGKEDINERVIYTQTIIQRQLELFEKLLVNKIADFYKKAPIDDIAEIIHLYFTKHARKEVKKLISRVHQDEVLFYESRLKTAQVIFDTVDDNRTKTIYLDNVLKKIAEREHSLVESVLSYQVNKDVSEDDIFGTDEIFGNCFSELVRQLQLSVDDADDIHQIATRYYNTLNVDMFNAIKKMIANNKVLISKNIENEMDKQQVRNGKTTAVYKMERNLTNTALEKMEELLRLIIERNKFKTRDVLSKYSSSLASAILELLPEEYKDQKELIGVIIDTNNDKLNSIIDDEINKLMANLMEKNKDQIQNEFYEEKRYKNIPTYICDFDSVDDVYPAILREVMIAYDISLDEIKPENNARSTEIHKKIFSQVNITKGVFRMITDNIVNENVRVLERLKIQMHETRINNNQRLMSNYDEPDDKGTQSAAVRK